MSKQIMYFAQARVLFSTVASVGPGDADVNTQKDRSTRVWVSSKTPDPSQGTNSIRVTVEYAVEEVHKDNTRLDESRNVDIQLPYGYQFVEFGGGYHDAQYEDVIRGKFHSWKTITNLSGIAGSCLDSCKIKIDDDGDDDEGGAQLDAHIMIPVVCNVKTENPSSGGETSDGTRMLDPTGYTYPLPSSISEMRGLMRKARDLGPHTYQISRGTRDAFTLEHAKPIR